MTKPSGEQSQFMTVNLGQVSKTGTALSMMLKTYYDLTNSGTLSQADILHVHDFVLPVMKRYTDMQQVLVQACVDAGDTAAQIGAYFDQGIAVNWMNQIVWELPDEIVRDAIAVAEMPPNIIALFKPHMTSDQPIWPHVTYILSIAPAWSVDLVKCIILEFTMRLPELCKARVSV